MPKEEKVKLFARVPLALEIELRRELLRMRERGERRSIEDVIAEALSAWLMRRKGEVGR